jgi:GTP-binding protein
VRQRIARTSAAPGKTRLANVYRVQRGAGAPRYLVDLPGYGYAGGNADEFRGLATDAVQRTGAALLIVDARHPGLEADRAAWRWLTEAAAASVGRRAIVANKIDKLSRAERLRAIREFEAVFDHPVSAVSADTGEGLDELWKLIDRVANNP